jgi:hypothetical protein
VERTRLRNVQDVAVPRRDKDFVRIACGKYLAYNISEQILNAFGSLFFANRNRVAAIKVDVGVSTEKGVTRRSKGSVRLTLSRLLPAKTGKRSARSWSNCLINQQVVCSRLSA